MEHSNILVVGGGIVGAAIAYHLAKLGAKDVTLLEKELFFGAESTAKCAGGIRAQFTTKVNIELSLASIKQFERFSEELGVPVDYRQVGYLFMATDEAQWRQTQSNVAFQQELGVPVELIGVDRIRERCPELELGDVRGGAFCPIDGLGDPHGFLHGYLKAARERGVVVHTQRPVTGFELAGDRIKTVWTPHGPIAADTVILAAGAWTGQLGKLLGLELPVAPVRRQIVTCAPMPWIDANWPMMVDNGSGLYMHPESGGLLLGMANKAEPPGFNTAVDEAFTEAIVEAAFRRMPRLEQAAIGAAWAGLYEVTPDHHPLLGRVGARENLLVAAGFSGHGFMHAPAAGEAIARMACGLAVELDLSSLAVDRFAAGGRALSDEVMVI